MKVMYYTMNFMHKAWRALKCVLNNRVLLYICHVSSRFTLTNHVHFLPNSGWASDIKVRITLYIISVSRLRLYWHFDQVNHL